MTRVLHVFINLPRGIDARYRNNLSAALLVSLGARNADRKAFILLAEMVRIQCDELRAPEPWSEVDSGGILIFGKQRIRITERQMRTGHERLSTSFKSTCAATGEVCLTSLCNAPRDIEFRQLMSVMNHLVNHRLSKKEQMRWSPAGAHYLLRVRAELLNGSFSESYRMVHARFRPPSTFVQAGR